MCAILPTRAVEWTLRTIDPIRDDPSNTEDPGPQGILKVRIFVKENEENIYMYIGW